MALIGNRSVLLKSPGRFLSGTVASIERSNFSTGGQRAGRFQAVSRILGGIPTGHLSPSSWSLPRTAGAMSSINEANFSITDTGLAVGGVTTTGTASFLIDFAAALGQLIASGSGSAALSITTNAPLITASLNADGSASFSLTFNTPTLGAEASGIGTASFVLSGTLSPYAIGQMIGSTEDATVLTSTAIAAAVWEQAIEAGFTAEQILRIIAAHAAGAATGLEGANPQFTGLDGVTLRIDGAYSAGTRTIDSLDGE